MRDGAARRNTAAHLLGTELPPTAFQLEFSLLPFQTLKVLLISNSCISAISTARTGEEGSAPGGAPEEGSAVTSVVRKCFFCNATGHDIRECAAHGAQAERERKDIAQAVLQKKEHNDLRQRCGIKDEVKVLYTPEIQPWLRRSLTCNTVEVAVCLSQ